MKLKKDKERKQIEKILARVNKGLKKGTFADNRNFYDGGGRY